MTAQAYSKRITEVERLVAVAEQAKQREAGEGWQELFEHWTSREVEAMNSLFATEERGEPHARADVYTVNAAVERAVLQADTYSATVAAEEWRAFWRDYRRLENDEETERVA